MRSNLILFVVLTLVAAGVVPRLLDRTGGRTAAPAASSAATAGSSGDQSVTIQRGGNGHYEIDAVVDGQHIDFLVDTGATSIVLTSEDAAKLGVFPAESEYVGVANTANGTVRFAPIELDRVEVGNIVVNNVAATVLPEGALTQSLLGMSFLSRVRWQQDRDRLVLAQ